MNFHHGLDFALTMELGKTFEQLITKSGEIDMSDDLEGRAVLYYKTSLDSIEKFEKGVLSRNPDTLFLRTAKTTERAWQLSKTEVAN